MNRKISKKVIGIDLGTSNSAVALNGEIITNKGERITPSVVLFNEKGEKEKVGEEAKREAVLKPDQVIFEVKRLMGRNFKNAEDKEEIEKFKKIAPYKIIEGDNGDVRIMIKGKNYSPEAISSFILEEMKGAAEEYLGEIIKEAVITVPAYFNDIQRTATKNAAEIAGFDPKGIRIVNEPTAASLTFKMDKGKENNIAVFDLGGGTFDISIVKKEIEEDGNAIVEVKATNGNTTLGGSDFDQKIVEWLIAEFKEDNGGIDLSNDKEALTRIKEEAEKAKHALSFVKEYEKVSIKIPFIYQDNSGPKHIDKKISQNEFEKMTKKLLDKLIDPCKKCIKDAKNNGIEKIDKVILVGGMTYSPVVRKKVKEIFDLEPLAQVNADEAVAIGASIQGGVLAGEITDILLQDVVSLSLGIETEGGAFTRIINRNDPILTKKYQFFSNATDYQDKVGILVYQGEREIARFNRKLGEFYLEIEKVKKNQAKIKVTFEINNDGILKVSAVDENTGKTANITITNSEGLSEAEKEKIILEAEKNRAEDEKFKERNLAYITCKNIEGQIEELKERKSFKEDDPQFQELKKIYEELEEIKERTIKDPTEDNHKELKEKMDKNREQVINLYEELNKKFPKEEEEKK